MANPMSTPCSTELHTLSALRREVLSLNLNTIDEEKQTIIRAYMNDRIKNIESRLP